MKNRVFSSNFNTSILIMLLFVFSTFYIISCTKVPSVTNLDISCLKEFKISLGENLESIIARYPDIKAQENTKGVLTSFYYYGDGNLEIEDTSSAEDNVLNSIIKMTFDEESKLEIFEMTFGCVKCSFGVKENYINAIETLQENGVECLDEFNLPDMLNNLFSKTISSQEYTKKVYISTEAYSRLVLTWEMNK